MHCPTILGRSVNVHKDILIMKRRMEAAQCMVDLREYFSSELRPRPAILITNAKCLRLYCPLRQSTIVMPSNATHKGEPTYDAWEVAEDSGFEHTGTMLYLPALTACDYQFEGLPNMSRKRTKVSLRVRSTKDAEHRRKLNKHTAEYRNRRAAKVPAGSEAPSFQCPSEHDRSNNANDGPENSLAEDEQQQHTERETPMRTSTSSATSHSRPRPAQQCARDHLGRDSAARIPIAQFGSGCNDPFSTLASDLPSAFVMERLYGSK
jgi:hypothetical protein